jgi:hypothetical protein
LQIDLPSLDVLQSRLGNDALGNLRRLLTIADSVPESKAPASLDLPLGAISRQLDFADAETGHWARLSVTTLVAGSNGVGLVGLPEPDAAESAELSEIFARAFGPHDWTCLPDPLGGYWLRSDQALEFQSVPPERALGRDVHDFLPTGAAANQWRRVAGEIEIELHHARLNQQRASRDLAPVNGVWVWANGALPERPEPTSGCIISDNRWQRLAAEWRGMSVSPLVEPRSLPDMPGIRQVVIEAEDTGLAQWISALPDLLKCRPQITVAGAGVFRLRPWHQLRFWRRS